MKTWIPFEEIEEELMRDQSFAEGVRLAELRLEQRLAAERPLSVAFGATSPEGGGFLKSTVT